jgi:hypothetical protein
MVIGRKGVYVSLECKRVAESASQQETRRASLAANGKGAQVFIFIQALWVSKYRWEVQSLPVGNQLGWQ